MDKIQRRTKTPVGEFLSRFRFHQRKPSSSTGTIPERNSLIRDDSSAPQAEVHPSSSVRKSSPEILHPSPRCQGPRSTALPDRSNYPLEFEEENADERRPTELLGDHESGGEELITYKRRARPGRPKRKDRDDPGFDCVQIEKQERVDGNAPIREKMSSDWEMACGEAPLKRKDLSPTCSPSTVETWKRLIGTQKTLAPKRVVGQYFLDLGQADFSYSTCPTCGLFYSRGHQNDERVHKSFHRNFMQGIQFKGWQNERVASRLDHKGNRVIVVSPNDTHRQRKVKEVIDVVEVELGLTPGWLLQRSCTVYLFISSSKKILGCLMAEPIQSAFRVVPTEDGSTGKTGEPSHCETKATKHQIRRNEFSQGFCSKRCDGLDDKNAMEIHAAGPDELEARRGCKIGEEAVRASSCPSGYAEASVATGKISPVCEPSAGTEGPDKTSVVKQEVCPCPTDDVTSGPEKISVVKQEVCPYPRDDVKQEPAVSLREKPKNKITDFFASRTPRVVKPEVEPEWSIRKDTQPDVKDTHLRAEDIVRQVQQNVIAMGRARHVEGVQEDDEKKSAPGNVSGIPPKGEDSNGSPLNASDSVKETDSTEDEKGRSGGSVMLFGNIKFSRETTSRKRASKGGTGDLGRAILCTKTAVPACCGVRVIWVSQTERRKGVASHLLDAMRKTFFWGIVLQPSQIAFSQPTLEGRMFAERYCQTREFLVYTTS